MAANIFPAIIKVEYQGNVTFTRFQSDIDRTTQQSQQKFEPMFGQNGPGS